jgi:hypothetical protein
MPFKQAGENNILGFFLHLLLLLMSSPFSGNHFLEAFPFSNHELASGSRPEAHQGYSG